MPRAARKHNKRAASTSGGPSRAKQKPGVPAKRARCTGLPFLIPGCVSTMRKARLPYPSYRDGKLVVNYPDARLEPKNCRRTKMRRDLCPCTVCRRLRRRKHFAACKCWLCYSDRMGGFIDKLGQRTVARKWMWFITLTFRMPHYPWAKGFPVEQPNPSSDYVRASFAMMLCWIKREVHADIQYFLAEQFGVVGGRLHLHCGLSWPGLFKYRWKDLQEMLWERRGFCKILPWKEHASYYIGRYIGREAKRCNWDFSVDFSEPARKTSEPVGRKEIVISRSVDDSSAAYRQTSQRLHR